MEQPSDEARYLASTLVQNQEQFMELDYDTSTSHVIPFIKIDENKLAEEIEKYFSSRC